MAYIPVGPALFFVGNPTGTGSSGMIDMGDTENISVDVGVRFAYASSARRQGTPLASSVYAMTPEPTASVELKSSAINQLEELILNSSIGGNGVTMGFGDEFTLITSLPTMCIIPVTEKTSDEDAAHGIWFPAAIISGVNGIAYGRVTEGEINNPYTTEVRSAYRETDQGSNDINPGFRLGWMGPPSNAGSLSGWTVPATAA